MFSGDRERVHWVQMGWPFNSAANQWSGFCMIGNSVMHESDRKDTCSYESWWESRSVSQTLTNIHHGAFLRK